MSGWRADGRKPVIGLSLGLHDFGDYAGVGFQRPLALAGGVGLGLPRVSGYLEDALDACDGILLGGGRDIDPSLLRAGAERAPDLHGASTRRVRARARRARARPRPPAPGDVPRDPDAERRARRHARPGRRAQARMGRAPVRPRLEGLEGGRALLARGGGGGAGAPAALDQRRAGKPPARGARGRRDRGGQLPPPGARRGRVRPPRGRARAGRRRRGGRAGRRRLRPGRAVGAPGGVAGRPPLPRALRPVRRGSPSAL